jgi:uncharacterized small protein (DUF1192 family)
MEKQTAENLMAFIEQEVADGKPFSPARWIEGALRVNSLANDLDSKVAHYEATIAKIEAEYIKQDLTASKAKALARVEIDLEDYLKCRAMINRIGEFLSLARRRSTIQEV